MSNIIKAKDLGDIKPFNFGEITRPPHHSIYAGQAGQPAGPEPSVEATREQKLAEIEEEVHNRMLEAERKAQELEEEGYRKGYEQGQKDGMEYGKQNVQAVKEQLEVVLQGLESVPQRVFADYREWFVTACLGAARQIAGRELKEDPSILRAAITELYQEAEQAQHYELWLNPKDVELLTRHTDFRIPDEDAAVALKPDSKLARGECRLETEFQVLNGGLDTRLQLLRERFNSVSDGSGESHV